MNREYNLLASINLQFNKIIVVVRSHREQKCLKVCFMVANNIVISKILFQFQHRISLLKQKHAGDTKFKKTSSLLKGNEKIATIYMLSLKY